MMPFSRFPGNCPRLAPKDAKYAIRWRQGELVVSLIYRLAGVYSKAEQCSRKALILGEFTWAGGYYRRGVLRRLSRPSASARLCWTRVCFDKTVATRGGPFSPCGG
jgi:hypothetical protein